MSEVEIYGLSVMAMICGFLMIVILAVIYISLWLLKSNGDDSDFPP